uniref:NADH-ubiquinone oxidoreductase chain 5 n=1 Tax=Sternaspis chinensis TaxID=2607890 RepID=A0A9E8G7N3_9ANNE|nr:NADH dehydrogenase subunit 5 [Sternaspis chinensis]UZT27137.1 NADH dehydrogenase subunit 5 [Sternaspis chinensis]
MSYLNPCKIASKYLWIMFLPMFFSSLILTLSKKYIILEWYFFSFNSTNFTLPLIIDYSSTLFSATVLFISANVLHFATSYMNQDFSKTRFTYLILLFVLSMNLMIFIPSLIALLLGWDGLGLMSFLLVIYYQTPKALSAGMITALMNRVGDVALLLSIAWLFSQGHWIHLSFSDSPLQTTIILSIMIAGMTKSAQIPFSSWLPAAMAAPTPVSALVHSSTLVTAGVFILIRFYPSLSTAPIFNKMLLMTATLTMLMAGMTAMLEMDLKKIIALSTLSQLGVMMMSLALNLPSITMFHLLTHALFKALLFVCAGSMIHHHHHSQDLRTMGLTSITQPLLSSCLLTANLALCGAPFLSGFYSKDMILESMLFNPSNTLIILLALLATSLTAAYSTRMMLNTLWSPATANSLTFVSDQDKNLSTPAIFLTAGAITSGAIVNWTLLPLNTPSFLSPSMKSLPLLVSLLGVLITWNIFTSSSLQYKPLSPNKLGTLSMWYLTSLTSQGLLKTPLNLSHNLLKISDQGWMEASSSKGMLNLSSLIISNTRPLQKSLITTQILLPIMIMLPLIFFL